MGSEQSTRKCKQERESEIQRRQDRQTGSEGREARLLPPVVHPVVRTHPETGRKLLFVNSNSTVRINELSERESDMLLAFLYEHTRTPDFQVRFKWDDGSVAFLDNRCTQHYAVPDYFERRILHRVTVKGDGSA